jgi:hypothetical protein
MSSPLLRRPVIGWALTPAVLAGPARLAHGHVVIEEYVERGRTRDGHEPRCAAVWRSACMP